METPAPQAGTPPTTQVAAAAPANRVMEVVNQLRTLRYFQGVIVVDFEGKLLGSDLPYTLPEPEIQKVLSNLWHASMSQAKQMGLGEFQYTAFEGENGGCFIVQSSECVTGMLFDKRRRLDQDGHELFEFCKNLC
jgi:predicted regulator of Ras-like GTPase activity (Roadblock/LC7/MglB family)